MAVRKIPIQSRSVAGYFYSVKNRKVMDFESQLERDCFYTLEFDDEVVEYEHQPVRIEGMLGSRKVTYIPDIYVFRQDGTEQLVEVKYTKDLSPEDEKKKAKLENRTRTIKEYCRQKGMQYLFFTEKDTDPTYLGNIKFLYRYREAPREPDGCKKKILDLARTHTTPEKVLEKLAMTDTQKMEMLPCIWHLLYAGDLETNLHIPLTNASVIKAAG